MSTRTNPASGTASGGLWSRVLGVGAVLLGLLALSACAAGPNPALDTGTDPAGFWLGLWQGFISPVTLIVSLFTDDVSIYEVQNNGNWYDVGFMIGVSAFFGGGAGGGAAGRRRR
jgi:hypothetical protein